MLHLVYEKHWVPSTRIRLRQLIAGLTAEGIPTRLRAVPADDADRKRFATSLATSDVVLIHRARPSRRMATWWSSLGVPLLYDFDDAIMFGRKLGGRGAWERWQRARGFRRMLDIAEGVACGNSWLAQQCAPYAGRLEILPSAVRTDVPQAKATSAGPLRIGWVGRSSNLHYVHAIAPALSRVAKETEARLVIVSDASISLPGIETEWIPWTLEREASAVASFSAGIMPLSLEDPWSRGKCAYKLLQTMAAGVPSVASNIGMNRDVVRPGENGWLASTQDDWARRLVSIANDPITAHQVGLRGRMTVETHYSVEAVAHQLAGFVRNTGNVPSSSGHVRSSTGATAKASALR